MKIAVTGANGFVGRSLINHLIEKNHHIVAVTRRPLESSKIDNCVVSNYRDPKLAKALQGFDCIIHLAALTHSNSKPTPKNLALYRKVNVENTLELANLAVSVDIKRFIYISSIKVNGEETYSAPFTHNAPPNPKDAYGISKWEAEQALQKTFADNKVELVIVRPPLVWSPNETKGNLGKLAKWLKLGLPLPSSAKNNRRDILSLINLCEFLTVCTDHPNAPGNTFLISDGTPRSSIEIAKMVTGIEPKTMSFAPWILKFSNHIARKLMSNLEVNIEHAKSILGWQPKT